MFGDIITGTFKTAGSGRQGTGLFQQAVPSLPALSGGRKVRAAQGIMLPNRKIPVRVWQVEQKITATTLSR